VTEVTIRAARPDDAPHTLALMRRALGEPNNYLITAPHEFSFAVEDERRFILDHLNGRNSCYFVAEAQPPHLVGMVTCRGGSRAATRHVTRLGITVAQGWRDRGIGRRLIMQVIAWGRASGVVRRIELNVMQPNTRAIHLYQSCGFVIEGQQTAAYLKDGQFVDNLMMGLVLG
jgi:ribosomal protein S18 acetylase RimI-like enzyme